MDGCSLPTATNLDELVVRSMISRMLSDNYTLVIIFIIAASLIIFILHYFVKQTLTVLKDYKNNKQQVDISKGGENEIYLDDDNDITMVDPKMYELDEKKKFYKDVAVVYKEYNEEKTNYLKATYGKTNDDYVDENIAYKQYDDYEKPKKQ